MIRHDCRSTGCCRVAPSENRLDRAVSHLGGGTNAMSIHYERNNCWMKSLFSVHRARIIKFEATFAMRGVENLYCTALARATTIPYPVPNLYGVWRPLGFRPSGSAMYVGRQRQGNAIGTHSMRVHEQRILGCAGPAEHNCVRDLGRTSSEVPCISVRSWGFRYRKERLVCRRWSRIPR